LTRGADRGPLAAQRIGGPALALEFVATVTLSTSMGVPERVVASGAPGYSPPMATLSRMKNPWPKVERHAPEPIMPAETVKWRRSSTYHLIRLGLVFHTTV
jgi:hypothetical protein